MPIHKRAVPPQEKAAQATTVWLTAYTAAGRRHALTWRLTEDRHYHFGRCYFPFPTANPDTSKPLTIDRFGRIVLPLALRDRHGLEAGTELDITDTGSGLLLTARRAPTVLSRLENGFPILSLPRQTNADLGALIARTRDDRDSRNVRPRPDADDA